MSRGCEVEDVDRWCGMGHGHAGDGGRYGVKFTGTGAGLSARSSYRLSAVPLSFSAFFFLAFSYLSIREPSVDACSRAIFRCPCTPKNTSSRGGGSSCGCWTGMATEEVVERQLGVRVRPRAPFNPAVENRHGLLAALLEQDIEPPAVSISNSGSEDARPSLYLLVVFERTQRPQRVGRDRHCAQQRRRGVEVQGGT